MKISTLSYYTGHKGRCTLSIVICCCLLQDDQLSKVGSVEPTCLKNLATVGRVEIRVSWIFFDPVVVDECPGVT